MKQFKIGALIGFCTLLSTTLKAVTYTSVASGAWNTTTNWSPEGTPNPVVDIININHSITFSGAMLINATGEVTVNNGGTLTVTGALTTGNSSGGGRFVLVSGAIANLNAWTITGTETISNAGTIDVANNFTTGGSSGGAAIGNTGNINVGGNLVHNAARTFSTSNGVISITGNFTVGSSGATWSASNSAVFVGGDFSTIGSGMFTSSGRVRVNGDLTASGNSRLNLNGETTVNGSGGTLGGSAQISVGGDMDVAGNFTGAGGNFLTVSGSFDVAGELKSTNSSYIDGTGVIGWGTYVTDNSGSDLRCNNGTRYDGNASTAKPFPPFNPFDLTTCAAGVLPVEFLFVRGENHEDYNTIEWATTTEINNDYFIVERSVNGANFFNVGVVDGAGNSSELLYYSFNDHNLLVSGYYYRIRQVDFDGKSAVSNTIFLKDAFNVSIYPNPSNGQGFTVNFNRSNQAEMTYEIHNAIGQSLETGIITTFGVSESEVRFTTDLATGVYFASFVNGSERVVHKFSVK